MKNNILVVSALLISGAAGYAQSSMIKGTVVDQLGNPVTGASVTLLNNPDSRVATDRKGVFVIAVNEGDKLLIESSDFRRMIIEADGETSPKIVMGYVTEGVDRGFGIAQTNEESTASISKVTSEKLMKSSAMSLQNALFGEVLGLTALQNGGTVWENGASFSIRGLQTLSDNGVVILVDGFERPINNLTREEVESVSVLKDAAAVALYGFRGINGVISIKTKRGIYGATDVTVSYDHAFTSHKNTPKFADAYTYANAMNEALNNDGKSAKYNQFELDAFKNGSMPGIYSNTSWMDEVLRNNGASNIYNVSVRGGAKRVRYYTMIDMENDHGFFNNTEENDGYSTQLKYSKANIRTNLDVDLSSSTKVELNILGVLAEHNRPGRHHNNIIDALYTLPAAAFPVKTYDGVWGGDATWTTANPVAGLQGTGYSKAHSRSLYADMKLTQQLDFITKGLKVSASLGYDNYAEYWENRTRDFVYGSDQLSFNGLVPTDTTRYSAGAISDLSFSRSLGSQWRIFNMVATLDYEKNIGKSSLYTSLIWNQTRTTYSGQHSTYNRQNFTLYGHYGYLGKYYLDMALVMAGSNRLPGNDKYAFSPTVSAAWVLSKERFLSDVRFVDFLKLRASAGIIHTDYVPEVNLENQSFDGGSSYPFGDNFTWNSGIAEGRIATISAMTERALKYNVGIDASMFKGLTLTVDGYFERRDHIYVSSSGRNSSVLGGSSPYINAGIVDSKGIEVGAQYEKRFNDLLISFGGNFTFSKNKIVDKLEEPLAYDYLKSEGKSIGQLFGLQAIGLFIDDEDIKNSPSQQFSEVKPGDIKYKDQNGDGVIDENDCIAMGYNTSVPEIYYSFNVGIEYKGFGVDALFQGAGNYSAMMMTKSVYQPLINNTNISEHYYNNRWTPETPFAKYPRLTTESNDNNYRYNSIWLADASFLKLRHCEVYYKIPSDILAKVRMKTAKVYVRGMDLFSFDKMDVFDPEVIGVSYPASRSINLGVALSF